MQLKAFQATSSKKLSFVRDSHERWMTTLRLSASAAAISIEQHATGCHMSTRLQAAAIDSTSAPVFRDIKSAASV